MAACRIVDVHKQIASLIGVSFAAGASAVDMTGRIVRGSNHAAIHSFCVCLLR